MQLGPDRQSSCTEYREYPSSQTPSLKLFAKFCLPKKKSGWIVVYLHGWHGEILTEHTDDVTFAPPAVDSMIIKPEMRGRGSSTGNPDCSGWELQDVVDAVEFARREYREWIAEPDKVELHGGSGGGGNAFGLLGKFPDYFVAARVLFGLSDYALLFEQDRVGELRDEMEGPSPNLRWKPWIGGSPATRPEAYASRGGLTTVRNLQTPTLVIHGDQDARAPVIQSRLWVGAAHGVGKGHLVEYHELRGVGRVGGHTGGLTPERMEAELNQPQRRFANVARHTVAIPDRGDFVVAGYLKTRQFEVIFDSVDCIGRVEYDLPRQEFKVFARTAREALLRTRRADGGWSSQRVTCAQTGG